MYAGVYYNSIDSKGRAAIPAKLRYGLEEQLRIMKSVDGCLLLLTRADWESYVAKCLDGRDPDDPDTRRLERFLFANSKDVQIDAQGRILIPSDHIEHAGIDKEVAFVGVRNRVEVWSREAFEREMEVPPGDLVALMHKAGRGGAAGGAQA